MTSIVIAPRVEDLTSDTEAVASGGWFRIRPSRAYKAGGQWVHPVWPASVTPLNGTAVTVKLDPIADVPYELELSIPDGNGGSYHPPNEFRYVTASASPLNWEDLIQEAGPGVGAPLPGSAEARLLALETLYSTLSGGASTLAGITDMTAVARTLNAKTTTATMLTYLGAGTSNLAAGTTTGTAADGGTVAALGTSVTGKADKAGDTFTGPITIPNGTLAGHAVNKSQLDAVSSAGVADATTGSKGKLALAGDLAGTADSPTVPGLAAKAPLSGAALVNPTATTPAVGDDSTKVATTAFVQDHTAWAYGIYPVVRWTGITWPTRSTAVPAGYTGPVVYDSGWVDAPSPTDRLGDGSGTSDRWTRKHAG